MLRTLKPLVIFCLAVLFAALTATLAYAQDPSPDPESMECEGCHEGLRVYWEESEHAEATSDPAFQQAWQDAGRPMDCLSCHTTGFDPVTGSYEVEGVACTACHYPIPVNHPDQLMPTEVSSRLCADCHVDTHAGWESSRHAKEDLACSQCHNPHTTDLRVGDSQALCQSCHKDESHYYSYTGHAESGVICVDCHLQVADDTFTSEEHGQRSHTMAVDLQTCAGCHETDIHANEEGLPSPAMNSGVTCTRTDTLEAMAGEPDLQLSSAPADGTLPSTLIIPAGFGLVLGVLVAPWLGNWRQRINGRKDDR